MIRLLAAAHLPAACFRLRRRRAHELRPAYLDIRETAAGDFAILWKTPAVEDRRLALIFASRRVQAEGRGGQLLRGGRLFRALDGELPRWTERPQPHHRRAAHDLTDVLVRLANADGSTQVARLTPETPSLVVTGSQTMVEVAKTYFLLGVEHILAGVDHLLFVLALMLLIRDRWMLLTTITAFTLAHSITLAGAALGLSQPAAEAGRGGDRAQHRLRRERTRPLHDRAGGSTSETYPWLVAFAFGLLHGFGFAGALKEIGLPQTDVPLALLTFNLGVEAGQLLFVAAVLVAIRAATALVSVPIMPARMAAILSHRHHVDVLAGHAYRKLLELTDDTGSRCGS